MTMMMMMPAVFYDWVSLRVIANKERKYVGKPILRSAITLLLIKIKAIDKKKERKG